MKRIRHFSIVVFTISILGGLAWWLSHLHETEPIYHGKRLSIWLDQFSGGLIITDFSPIPSEKLSAQIEARNAIRECGTNCLPLLLTMVAAKDSAAKARILALIRKQSLFPFKPRTDWEKRTEAIYGFLFLGPVDEPAVPQLIRLLEDKDADVRCNATIALRCIGNAAQDAVPGLVRHLNDQNGTVREAVTNALKRIDPEAAAKAGTR